MLSQYWLLFTGEINSLSAASSAISSQVFGCFLIQLKYLLCPIGAVCLLSTGLRYAIKVRGQTGYGQAL